MANFSLMIFEDGSLKPKHQIPSFDCERIDNLKTCLPVTINFVKNDPYQNNLQTIKPLVVKYKISSFIFKPYILKLIKT